jgi:Bacterial protein of unknown function (Gcw_chp)
MESGKGLRMKKIILASMLATVAAAPAMAADLYTKAPPLVAAPVVPAFDIAFGAALMTDYNFRGISQSDRGPSVFGYVEPRFKITPNIELYAGIGAWSVTLPTQPAGEWDLYGGIRPTFGPVTFDFGLLYYYYPREKQVFTLPTLGPVGQGFPTTQPDLVLPFAPWTKANTDFLEFYGKVSYTWNDILTLGASVNYSANWLNTGADGTYANITAKLALPAGMLPKDIGAYVSGELGHYWLGRTDAFFLNIDLPNYTYWNLGLGLTYKAFTLDLRYHDTDATRAECFVLTGDLNGLDTGRSPGRSRWCSEAFIAKLSVDTTLNAFK